jgi:hypothetical protein
MKVSAQAAEANLSDLLNAPRLTLARLGKARWLVLRRRGEEALVLTTVTRAEQDTEVTNALIRAFAEIMREPTWRSVMSGALSEVFPWMRYLPARDQDEFVADYVAALRAAADLDNTAPVAQTLVEWKATAEAHADPELYRALITDSDEDHGQVPEPGPAA